MFCNTVNMLTASIIAFCLSDSNFEEKTPVLKSQSLISEACINNTFSFFPAAVTHYGTVVSDHWVVSFDNNSQEYPLSDLIRLQAQFSR